MSKLDSLFNDYLEFHRTPGNKTCHFIGIPAILVSTLGLLALARIGDTGADAGLLVWLAGAIWYVMLDWRLGGMFSVVALGCYFAGRGMPLWLLLVLFVGGWVFQGIGHVKYEKKSPAFLRNLRHVLIGPLWIFASLIRYQHKETVS